MMDSCEPVPRIGITTYGVNKENQFPLPAEYVQAVRRAGGLPVLIAPGETRIEQLLGILDGVILAGGGDIAPDCYGGETHSTVYMVDSDRDRMEIALIRALVARQMPTLGICRGCQIVNVALGGTLHAHLPDTFGETTKHRLPPREPVPHDVTIEADTRLARVMGVSRTHAASWHHQANCDVASGLRVVARAPDGVIEALEMVEHPWFVAVQWHPELTAAEDPVQQRLFEALVDAACRPGSESGTIPPD